MATIEDYRKQLNELEKQKSEVASNSLKDAETSAINSKISNAQTLLNSYANSVNNMQSAKAEAYSAKQNAIANANAILGYSGYGSQGMSETTRANMANAYSNQLADANAKFNQSNSDMYKAYQEEATKIEDARYANQTAIQSENYDTLVDELNTDLANPTQSAIDEYRTKIDSMLDSGEISQAQYNALEKALTGTVQSNYDLTTIGAKTEPVNLGSYLTDVKQGTNQNDAIEMLQTNPQAFVDAGLLSDGDVIDINWGKGTKLVVYKNGNFYELDGNSTSAKKKKNLNAKSISDMYKALNGKIPFLNK